VWGWSIGGVLNKYTQRKKDFVSSLTLGFIIGRGRGSEEKGPEVLINKLSFRVGGEVGDRGAGRVVGKW